MVVPAGRSARISRSRDQPPRFVASCAGKRLSLQEALDTILRSCPVLPAEQVVLERAAGRITARDLPSLHPKPAFSQATRDGYALGPPAADSEQHTTEYLVIGELAAGSVCSQKLGPGTAIRIMTGAMIPRGCRVVVPQEFCKEEDGRVAVKWTAPAGGPSHIRWQGSELAVGECLVNQGEQLHGCQLALLADSGYNQVPVYRQARVAILCTGSELVQQGSPLRKGQKISTNGILLATLTQTLGAGLAVSPRTVGDDPGAICSQLDELVKVGPDLLITTGGMGPGKFDLMQKIFADQGASILYDRLAVRPGKSTMFGLLAGIPFFSLPGPPPAVKILFHELVAPALKRMAGWNRVRPPAVEARLTEEVTMKQDNWLCLKGGFVRLDRSGRLLVRPAATRDRINGILLLPGGGGDTVLAVGRTVSVHLVAEPGWPKDEGGR